MTASPELMRIFDFTAADLEANRAGKLSKTQTQSIKSESSVENFLAGCLFQMIILCIGIVLFASGVTSKKYPFAEMIIIFCFIVVGLGYIVLTYKDHQNAYQKTVQTQRAGWVEGEVTLSVQVVFNQRDPAYQLVIDGKAFQVERSLYMSFEGLIKNMGTRPIFRIYFAPEINRILSMEIVPH